MGKNLTYFDLHEACRIPGCLECHLAQRSVEHYLDALFYEHVNDGWVRNDLRRGFGYCHEHDRDDPPLSF